MNNSFFRNVAQNSPLLLIAISIGGALFGGLVLSRWDYSIRGLVIAIPFIAAALVLPYFFKNNIEIRDPKPLLSNKRVFSIKSFIIIYLLSLIILLLGIDRLIYFAIIIFAYSTIFAQIFIKDFDRRIILAEICLVMANVIYSITLTFPLFFKTTDVLGHIYISSITFLSGHTIPEDLMSSYSPFPLYHIFVAVGSNILNLPIQNTLFLLTCPAYIILVLFIYKITEIISGNKEISLLTCFFYSINGIVLNNGIEMITGVTAYVGFVILFYLIFKYDSKDSRKIIFQSLALVLSIFIILVHQVSIVLILFLISLIIICEYAVNEKKYFSKKFILLIFIIFIGYWTYLASRFISWLGIGRLNLDAYNLATRHFVMTDPNISQYTAALIFIYDYLDICIFTFFAILGIILILWKSETKYLKVIGLFSLVSLILYLPNPLFTTRLFALLFRIDRFWILLSPFMAIMMAYGFAMAINYLQNQKIEYKRIFSVFLAIIFFIYAITSLYSIIIVDSSDHRLYFTSDELDGFNFIFDNIPYGSNLRSDYFTSRFFIQTYFSLSEELRSPYYNSDLLRDLDTYTTDEGYVIIRESEFMNNGLLFGSISAPINYPPNLKNTLKLFYFKNSQNKIFSSERISIFKNKITYSY